MKRGKVILSIEHFVDSSKPIEAWLRTAFKAIVKIDQSVLGFHISFQNARQDPEII